ncbi:MAG: SGNH/GDSL hydrolase family protein [Clostridia bacterium]|nr:SGNH/GDSL hydrolase family protein [Clostridia bacterium]
MDIKVSLFAEENELPLQRFADDYSSTSIFRSVAFIGDSLSSGEFETYDEVEGTGYHDFFDYSWGRFMARKNGFTAYSFSQGGMTAEAYVNSFAEEMGYWDPQKKAQAYVIALGVNDILNEHQPIGTIDDICTEDPAKNAPTFAGYYGAIVSRYKAICPDAKFFFVTFPKTDAEEQTADTLAHRDLLYKMADFFENSYVIDLYQYGPVYDERFREHYYLYNHLSPAGYLLTARLIDSYIDYIIRHNPQDFKYTGFIGTEIRYQ